MTEVEKGDVDSRITRIELMVLSSPEDVVLCEATENERRRLLRAVYYGGFQDGRNVGVKMGLSDAISTLAARRDKL